MAGKTTSSNQTRELIRLVWGEFIGTFVFLWLAFVAVQATVSTELFAADNSRGHLASKILFIAFAFGGGVTVGVWLMARVSGGMLNPAISFGLALIGAISPLKAVIASVAQLAGGIAAAAVMKGLTNGHGPMSVSNTLSEGTSVVQGFFLEVFLTAQLVLTVIMLVIEKHDAPWIAPPAIGVSLFMAHLSGVGYTGVSVNPARTLGPAIFEGFPGYCWIYWIGPLVGALLAAGVYMPIKYLRPDETLLVDPHCDHERGDLGMPDRPTNSGDTTSKH